jgi:tetratricopeptide (TPR) repeat protein
MLEMTIRRLMALMLAWILVFCNPEVVFGQASNNANKPTDINQEKPASENAPQPVQMPTGPNGLPVEPMVARVQMQLALNEKVIDTIEIGDLLTVIGLRGESYIIQTFNGTKGVVAKSNVATLAESIPVYDALIEAQPKEGRLYTLRAGAQWSKGANDKALADFNQAIDLGYEAAHAFASRGLFHAAMGEYEAATRDYTTAIEKDPKDEMPIVNRASVYMSTGKYEDAVNDYTTVIGRNSSNAAYFQQRAIAQKFLGNLDKAAIDYSKAIELQPSDVAAWLGRGFLMFQMDKYQSAVDDFSKVIELAPNTAVAFNNRGYNYQMLKQYEKAIADYDQALKLAPKYILALQNRGWLLTLCEDKTLRNPEAAVESSMALCELSQFRDLSDLTLLAAAHAAKGDYETAIGWQEKVVEKAVEPQKSAAKRILENYQQKKPLDPKLLEVSEETEESPAPESPKSEESKNDNPPEGEIKSIDKQGTAPKTGS